MVSVAFSLWIREEAFLWSRVRKKKKRKERISISGNPTPKKLKKKKALTPASSDMFR